MDASHSQPLDQLSSSCLYRVKAYASNGYLSITYRKLLTAYTTHSRLTPNTSSIDPCLLSFVVADHLQWYVKTPQHHLHCESLRQKSARAPQIRLPQSSVETGTHFIILCILVCLFLPPMCVPCSPLFFLVLRHGIIACTKFSFIPFPLTTLPHPPFLFLQRLHPTRSVHSVLRYGIHFLRSISARSLPLLDQSFESRICSRCFDLQCLAGGLEASTK